jgi:rare lipoprotein A
MYAAHNVAVLSRRFTLCAFAVLVFAGETAQIQATSPKLAQCMMVSSYYGRGFHGRRTASGAPFDKTGLTAAHRTLPFGTRLRLTYPRTSVSVTVEITDRGPYSTFNGIQYYTGRRDLDVSEGVARLLGFQREGLANLQVEFLLNPGLAPPCSDDGVTVASSKLAERTRPLSDSEQ